jgi:hypothetical protein
MIDRLLKETQQIWKKPNDNPLTDLKKQLQPIQEEQVKREHSSTLKRD